MERGRSVQDHPWLCSQFKTRLDCVGLSKKERGGGDYEYVLRLFLFLNCRIIALETKVQILMKCVLVLSKSPCL